MSENTMPLREQGQATSPTQCTTKPMRRHVCTCLCPAMERHHHKVNAYQRDNPTRWPNYPAYCHIAERIVFPYRDGEKCAIDVSDERKVFEGIRLIHQDLCEAEGRLNRLLDAVCEELDQRSCEEAESCR